MLAVLKWKIFLGFIKMSKILFMDMTGLFWENYYKISSLSSPKGSVELYLIVHHIWPVMFLSPMCGHGHAHGRAYYHQLDTNPNYDRENREGKTL